ncbi:YktB family protein [Salsuginibacillus kocurii]|uniref:YktB family protein n=1 Tax=Salsuginibacillus kocurii TaxID=427078 RepID=UPI0003826FD0|nr:DUF1054 domain-containing protein [Salsuginibacillus kocurii]
MTEIQGFTKEDFNVFTIPGLEERMDAIRTHIQPKFDLLGKNVSASLSTLTGDEMHYHIAKHARRKVNPPEDTWVAFADSKRGYKKLPHFQVGLFESHLFIWFAMIYEAPAKGEFAEALLPQLNDYLQNVPSDYVWSIDHTKPEAMKQKDLTAAEIERHVERLKKIKKAELLVGRHLNPNDENVQDGARLQQTVEETFETVLPFYQLAKSTAVPSK